MALKTNAWDSAAALRTPEEISAYMDAVLEHGDAALVAHAIGVVARTEGMSKLARETGLARESLYRSLSSDGNPSFSTVLEVLKALGIRLRAEPAERAENET